MEIKHGYLPQPTKDDSLSDTTVPRFMSPLSRRRVDERVDEHGIHADASRQLASRRLE